MTRTALLLAPFLLAACNAANDPLVRDSNDLAANAAAPAEGSSATGDPASAGNSAAGNAATVTSAGMPVPPNPSNDCVNVSASDFAAWVNAMPGPGRRPTLIVTGKVTTPTGGYRVLFTDLRVAESNPVQVTAELAAVPPDGMASQAVMTHEVRGSWPITPPVGSVTVRCGVKTLARISPVETAY